MMKTKTLINDDNELIFESDDHKQSQKNPDFSEVYIDPDEDEEQVLSTKKLDPVKHRKILKFDKDIEDQIGSTIVHVDTNDLDRAKKSSNTILYILGFLILAGIAIYLGKNYMDSKDVDNE